MLVDIIGLTVLPEMDEKAGKDLSQKKWKIQNETHEFFLNLEAVLL